MNTSIPQTMKAAAIDRFGGPEVLKLESLPVPRPQKTQVLIRIDTAGIGVWDPEVREGEVELGRKRKFPRVIGNDGAGTVVAVGSAVRRFQVGDRVYAFAYDGGFYAEYVAVSANDVARIPPGLSPRQAGGLGADVAVDGRKDDVAGAVRAFAPDGLDAALVLSSARGLEDALRAVRRG